MILDDTKQDGNGKQQRGGRYHPAYCNGLKPIPPQEFDRAHGTQLRRLYGEPEPFDDALQERFLATLQDPQFRAAVLVSLGLEGGVQ